MRLAVVIPVYNEAVVIGQTVERICDVLTTEHVDFELLLVDDGSGDGTGDILRQLAASDARIKVLGLSRNFGHQAALTAGLDVAEADAVVVMDADQQDPPELLIALIAGFRAGWDIVSPRRVARNGESLFKRVTAKAFYTFMNLFVDRRLASEVGDFRLFSRRAVLALRAYREHNRFLRGIVASLGLPELFVPFTRQPRAAGNTKYKIRNMIRLAWTATTAASGAPLRMGFLFASLFSVASIATVLLTPAWASRVILGALALQSLAMGIMGEYLLRIHDQSKCRPLYIVSWSCNIDVRKCAAENAVFLPPRESITANARN